MSKIEYCGKSIVIEDLERFNELIEQIEEELEYVDIKPYSHNMVAIQLQILEETCFKGRKELFLKVIQDLLPALEEKGWGHLFIEECDKCGREDVRVCMSSKCLDHIA